MITLTAKINLLSNFNNLERSSTLKSIESNLSGSNVSVEINQILGVKKQGGNPFILGVSLLGGGDTLSDGEDFFIGEEPANANGIFERPYVFTLQGTGIKALEIVFDTYNNQYAPVVVIDGVAYENSSTVFSTANIDNSLFEHTIEINSWSVPNYPLRIQGIYVSLSILVNRENLIGIESKIVDRSDLKLPSWGIISNTGNIEFNDANGSILQYIEEMILTSGLDVEIRLNNTFFEGKSELIGKFQTDEWNYDNDNRIVSVSIKDDLEEWQNINVEEISFNPKNPTPQNCEYFYDYLYNKTIKQGNYQMLSYDELDSDTKYILHNTYIQYPMLKGGSLWNCWNKLCQVCQLHIYKNSEGIVVCRYNGGN